jgi:hypothetical protein
MPGPELHISVVGEEVRMQSVVWYNTDIPEPAPVTIADFPLTEKGALMSVVPGLRVAIVDGVGVFDTTAWRLCDERLRICCARRLYIYLYASGQTSYTRVVRHGMCCTELA